MKVYLSEVDKINSNFDNRITKEWLEKAIEKNGIKDGKRKESIKKNYLQNNSQSDIHLILRKR